MNLKEFKKEILKDPKVKKAYKALKKGKIPVVVYLSTLEHEALYAQAYNDKTSLNKVIRAILKPTVQEYHKEHYGLISSKNEENDD